MNGIVRSRSDLPILLEQLQYPGMSEPESEILRRWLRKYGAEWELFGFNVRLGLGQEPIDGLDANVARAQTLLTQKRADLIVRRGDEHLILEVKWRAGLGVLGQLLGYRDLWMIEFPQLPEPRVGVIAALADQDTKRVLADHDIPLEILTP
jgi:hypothetical protein